MVIFCPAECFLANENFAKSTKVLQLLLERIKTGDLGRVRMDGELGWNSVTLEAVEGRVLRYPVTIR